MFPQLATVLLGAGLVLGAAGCGRSDVNLKRDLEIRDISTGWLDGGIVQGPKNKLQPSATFRLKNRGSEPLSFVQITAVFLRVTDPTRSTTETWGDSTIFAIHKNSLQPGQETGPFTVYSEEGYTGEEPRAKMLTNSNFRDVRVRLFGKHRAADPVPLGEYLVTRKLAGTVPKS